MSDYEGSASMCGSLATSGPAVPRQPVASGDLVGRVAASPSRGTALAGKSR
jgi:hypothetical protein